MDEDQDGVIKVSHVLKVIELLGTQESDLRGKQINKIIEMLAKEEMLEVESNIEKVLETYEEADGKADEDLSLEQEVDKVISKAQDRKEGKGKKPPPPPSSSSSSSKKEEETTETVSRKVEDDVAKDLTEEEPEEHIKEMFEGKTKDGDEDEEGRARMTASCNGEANGDKGKIDLK